MIVSVGWSYLLHLLGVFAKILLGQKKLTTKGIMDWSVGMRQLEALER